MNQMERLAQILIRHEGLKLKAYVCPAGKITIGVGRNLEDRGIYPQEAMMMLENDIQACAGEAAEAFPWFLNLDETRQVVIISMIFNLGLEGFKKFKKMTSAMALGQYDTASSEMLQSQWAGQVGRRAAELAQMMRTGRYVEPKEGMHTPPQ